MAFTATDEGRKPSLWRIFALIGLLLLTEFSCQGTQSILTVAMDAAPSIISLSARRRLGGMLACHAVVPDRKN